MISKRAKFHLLIARIIIFIVTGCGVFISQMCDGFIVFIGGFMLYAVTLGIEEDLTKS